LKIKIIILSVFAAFLMAMLPSIQAVEHEAAVEAKEKWIEENVDAIQKLFDDSDVPDGIILNILKWIVKILLIPVKLAIKLTGFLLRTTWNLFTFTIQLLLFILPPYNFGPCSPC
jgi:hypothetical protein